MGFFNYPHKNSTQFYQNEDASRLAGQHHFFPPPNRSQFLGVHGQQNPQVPQEQQHFPPPTQDTRARINPQMPPRQFTPAPEKRPPVSAPTYEEMKKNNPFVKFTPLKNKEDIYKIMEGEEPKETEEKVAPIRQVEDLTKIELKKNEKIFFANKELEKNYHTKQQLENSQLQPVKENKAYDMSNTFNRVYYGKANDETLEILNQYIQNERNGYVFYNSLKNKAKYHSDQDVLREIASMCNDMCQEFKNLYKQMAGEEGEYVEELINQTIGYHDGLRLALKEEINALNEYYDLLSSFTDAGKEILGNIIKNKVQVLKMIQSLM